MARYNNGINGPVSGKVGSVIASSWRGINYLKSVQDGKKKQSSPAQIHQQRIFALVSGWLRPLKALIAIGYQVVKEKKTPMNAAISFVMKHAVSGSGDDMVIDFANVVFSRGELLISVIKEIVSLVDAVLYIKWEDVLGSAYCKDDDQANFVVYNPDKEKFVMFENVAVRSAKEVNLQLPANFLGDTLHCYMHYVNAQGNMLSTGQYLGQIVV
ncbi:DUF6266 family protein [Pedobacter frigoris]|uniref:DUF6266 family protein n=1 Tax=Pedobacter frigoris TaxID=2571272 RepID=UPI00292FE5EF|nr:DUF6266 family protein [Pedobacter frigoris]